MGWHGIVFSNYLYCSTICTIIHSLRLETESYIQNVVIFISCVRVIAKLIYEPNCSTCNKLIDNS